MWSRLQQMVQNNVIPQLDLSKIYGIRMHFSVTFRDKYSVWIETQDWDKIAASPQRNEIGKSLFDEIIQMMKLDSADMQLVQKITFDGSVEDFENHYRDNYDEFVNMMCSIIRNEIILMQSTQEDMGEDRHSETAKENAEIRDKVKLVKGDLKRSGKQLQELESMQEEGYPKMMELSVQIKKLARLQQQPQPEDLSRLNKEFHELGVKIANNRHAMGQTLTTIYSNTKQILEESWKELDAFKEDQRLACTMLRKPKENSIETLEKMFEGIAEILVTLLNQQDRFVIILRQIQYTDEETPLHAEENYKFMNEYLKEHLNRVFIVDKIIPKQVLKVTNGKSATFLLSARLLGGTALGLQANTPKVTAKLYPEKQLTEVMQKEEEVPPCCKMENNKDKVFQFINHSCFVSFDHMVISGMKREGKGRNDDFVTDYKHAFIFTTTIRILDGTFKLKTMSLPIVITSQTSQECMARGTIIWGAAFPKPVDQRKTPFDAEEEVKWKDFADVMNAMFIEYTKRPLTADNIKFLAQKAFRESNDLDFDQQSIKLKNVMKDRLPGCDFPFWKWFMACMNSVKDTVHSEWKEGLIYGFISKKKAEEILIDKFVGTFLIRFSESLIEQGQRADIHGSLTVAVNERDPETGRQTVFHIKEALTHKDLYEKRLGPILDAYQVQDYANPTDSKATKKLLTCLWTPVRIYGFEDVFGKHIKEKEKSHDGYRRGRYVIEIFLADQNPRRPSTHKDLPPESPAQSEYSEYDTPVSPFSILNMMDVSQLSLQNPPQVARIAPISQSSITTLVNLNTVNGYNQMDHLTEYGPEDPLNVYGDNFTQMLSDAIIGSNHVNIDNDGDIMLNDINPNYFPQSQ